MTTYVALLRAVNVGGTGKLPMKELAELCRSLGYADVRTYIQSGNVVLLTDEAKETVRERLERALSEKMARKAEAIVLESSEMRQVLERNPFGDAHPSRVVVIFTAGPVDDHSLVGLRGPDGEEVAPGDRVVYVHYPNGMGKSKLKLPPLPEPTTARNINTVTQLVSMCPV